MAAGTEIYLTQVSAETQKEHTMQLYQTRMQVRYLGDSRPAAFVAHMAGQSARLGTYRLQEDQSLGPSSSAASAQLSVSHLKTICDEVMY